MQKKNIPQHAPVPTIPSALRSSNVAHGRTINSAPQVHFQVAAVKHNEVHNQGQQAPHPIVQNKAQTSAELVPAPKETNQSTQATGTPSTLNSAVASTQNQSVQKDLLGLVSALELQEKTVLQVSDALHALAEDLKNPDANLDDTDQRIAVARAAGAMAQKSAATKISSVSGVTAVSTTSAEPAPTSSPAAKPA